MTAFYQLLRCSKAQDLIARVTAFEQVFSCQNTCVSGLADGTRCIVSALTLCPPGLKISLPSKACPADLPDNLAREGVREHVRSSNLRIIQYGRLERWGFVVTDL